MNKNKNIKRYFAVIYGYDESSFPTFSAYLVYPEYEHTVFHSLKYLLPEAIQKGEHAVNSP